LYGEEATRQAQKEGEEAAAAYEQEKRDIASGKIPAPAAAAKPEKKKKKKEKKEQNDKAPSTPKNSEKRPAPEGVQSSGTAEKSTEKTKKRKSTGKSAPSTEKKPKSARKEAPKLETIAPVLAKGVTKVSLCLVFNTLIRTCSRADTLVLRSTGTNPGTSGGVRGHRRLGAKQNGLFETGCSKRSRLPCV
jgi:outer membrane biosynthesis protein TonB